MRKKAPSESPPKRRSAKVGPEKPADFGPQLPSGPAAEKLELSFGPSNRGEDRGERRKTEHGALRGGLSALNAIHSNENYKGEIDKNLSLWLGRGKAAAGDGLPEPKGKGKGGGGGMSSRSSVFSRNKGARGR